jgi:hypothetical protein
MIKFIKKIYTKIIRWFKKQLKEHKEQCEKEGQW